MAASMRPGRRPAHESLPGFAVATRLGLPRVVIEMVGELDLAGRELVVGACRGAEATDVIVDLSELHFMDCAGYGALITAALDLARRGGSLRLIGVGGQPARLITLLERLHSAQATVEQASPTGRSVGLHDPLRGTWTSDRATDASTPGAAGGPGARIDASSLNATTPAADIRGPAAVTRSSRPSREGPRSTTGTVAGHGRVVDRWTDALASGDAAEVERLVREGRSARHDARTPGRVGPRIGAESSSPSGWSGSWV